MYRHVWALKLAMVPKKVSPPGQKEGEVGIRNLVFYP